MTLREKFPIAVIFGFTLMYTAYAMYHEITEDLRHQRAHTWEQYKRTDHYQDDLRHEAATTADPHEE